MRCTINFIYIHFKIPKLQQIEFYEPNKWVRYTLVVVSARVSIYSAREPVSSVYHLLYNNTLITDQAT